jgi:capsular polysaccharide transport system permease protein
VGVKVSVEGQRESGFVADVAPYPHWQVFQERSLRAWALIRRWPAFTLVVALPTVLAAIYYGLIAAPIYTSTAEFIVKDANQNVSLSGLTSFLQSTGLATSTNDAYSVAAYLTSRDVVAALERKPGIRTIYNRPEADFIAKFPTLLFRPSFENLYWHFTWWTEVEFDTTTNVTTIYVWAFRAKDAQFIANELLDEAESQVNRMNDRARFDAIKGALREVKTLEQRNTIIQKKITAFRNKYLYLDPNASGSQAVALLSGLEADIASTRASVAQLQKSAPSSPQIPGLDSRIESLQQQIAVVEHNNAGAVGTLAPKMEEYGALLLDQSFVQLMLQTAVTTLEGAEATVQQQEMYVERVAEANLPDIAFYPFPYGLLDFLLVAMTTFFVYVIGKVLVRAVLEHLD